MRLLSDRERSPLAKTMRENAARRHRQNEERLKRNDEIARRAREAGTRPQQTA